MELFNQFGIDLGYVVIGLAGVILALLILFIIIIVKQSKLKKQYKQFMIGKDGKSLEENFSNKFKFIEELRETTKDITERLDIIEFTLKNTYQKTGIVKYDAFNEMGGKLSFALCVLTNANDGYLINSMHSTREGCFTYIKEIKNGKCAIILSEEEQEALDLALNDVKEKPHS